MILCYSYMYDINFDDAVNSHLEVHLKSSLYLKVISSL